MRAYRTQSTLTVDLRHGQLKLYAPWLSERAKAELGFCLMLRDPRVPFGWRPAPRPPPSYRWLKMYVGWPRALAHNRHTIVIEAETHRTRGPCARTTVKSFVRLKAGRGSPKA